MGKFWKTIEAAPPITPTTQLKEKSGKRNVIGVNDFVEFVRMEFGNDTTRLLTSVNGVLGMGKLFTKNKRTKDIIAGIQAGTSAVVFGIEMYSKVANYVKNRENKNNDMNTSYRENVAKELEVPEVDVYDGLRFDETLVKWLISTPSTTKFKIMKTCRVNGSKIVPMDGDAAHPEVHSPDGYSTQEIMFICQLENGAVKFAIHLEFTNFSDTFFVHRSHIIAHDVWSHDRAGTIYSALLRDYIDSLDTENTIIRFDNYSIKTYPRRKCLVKVNQFDVEYLAKEIREVLKSKRRRAIVLAGKQGVGKSSILRYLEDNIRDHMIFHLTPSDFTSSQSIRMRFEVIQAYQPVILLIEDIDDCGMERKNGVAGTFLDCIDEVNKNLNIFILVTVNDTSLVHSTLIDRPGRFDRVYEVLTPRTIKEVGEVVEAKINAIKTNYYPDSAEFENVIIANLKDCEKFYETCLNKKFTQAEITEAIVEQAIIDMKISEKPLDSETFEEYLMDAVDKHNSTKRVLDKYSSTSQSSDDDDGFFNDDDEDGDCVCESEPIDESFDRSVP